VGEPRQLPSRQGPPVRERDQNGRPGGIGQKRRHHRYVRVSAPAPVHSPATSPSFGVETFLPELYVRDVSVFVEMDPFWRPSKTSCS
jgi:hypothetical protein